jgi:hypothetical protein
VWNRLSVRSGKPTALSERKLDGREPRKAAANTRTNELSSIVSLPLCDMCKGQTRPSAVSAGMCLSLILTSSGLDPQIRTARDFRDDISEQNGQWIWSTPSQTWQYWTEWAVNLVESKSDLTVLNRMGSGSGRVQVRPDRTEQNGQWIWSSQSQTWPYWTEWAMDLVNSKSDLTVLNRPGSGCGRVQVRSDSTEQTGQWIWSSPSQTWPYWTEWAMELGQYRFVRNVSQFATHAVPARLSYWWHVQVRR